MPATPLGTLTSYFEAADNLLTLPRIVPSGRFNCTSTTVSAPVSVKASLSRERVVLSVTRTEPALLPRKKSTQAPGPVLIVLPEYRTVPTLSAAEGAPGAAENEAD